MNKFKEGDKVVITDTTGWMPPYTDRVFTIKEHVGNSVLLEELVYSYTSTSLPGTEKVYWPSWNEANFTHIKDLTPFQRAMYGVIDE